MRNLVVSIFVTLLAIATLPFITLAQEKSEKSGTAKSDAPFDPHDLTGVWEFFIRIPPNQGIYATPSKDVPPRTPWGQAKYDAAKPGYGPKAQPAGNDPILKCMPAGVPRIMLFVQAYEIVRSSDRVSMFFEREHTFRQIWTDGRQHPQDPDPTYMGDSIGKWEGDTFVVDSVGFNDNAWLDFFGNPHSDQMHVVERYRRLDHDDLSLQFTVEDPKAFTKAWESDTKVYKLLPKNKAFLAENFCISEEEDHFNKTFNGPDNTKPEIKPSK
jgi:hypothetical protein